MYSERILTGDLSPPIRSNNMDDWSDQAPFVFDDFRPSWPLGLAFSLRQLPTRGLIVLAVAVSLICAMAIVLNDEVGLTLWSLSPSLALFALAGIHSAGKWLLGRLSTCPADLGSVSALAHRAACYEVRGPMVDAQARTNDCWRVGHVRQAQAVLDRIRVIRDLEADAAASAGPE